MNKISYSCQLEGDGCEKYQENVQDKVKSTEKKESLETSTGTFNSLGRGIIVSRS